jgi:hypothetical protein
MSEEHKRRIVQSDGEDTVYTEVLDIVEEKVFGIKWPDRDCFSRVSEPLRQSVASS